MNTQDIPTQSQIPMPQASWRIKPVPRLPRQQRQPCTPKTQFAQAVSVLRQRTRDLMLRAVENGVSQDAMLFEQITTEAGAFNTAAAWLSSQGYPAGFQEAHPLID
jgi:hypothetical protein